MNLLNPTLIGNAWDGGGGQAAYFPKAVVFAASPHRDSMLDHLSPCPFHFFFHWSRKDSFGFECGRKYANSVIAACETDSSLVKISTLKGSFKKEESANTRHWKGSVQ